MNKLMWWGYLHQNGTIQVKRWFGDHEDYRGDCIGNPFVQKVVPPFEAASREEAIDIIAKELNMKLTKEDIEKYGTKKEKKALKETRKRIHPDDLIDKNPSCSNCEKRYEEGYDKGYDAGHEEGYNNGYDEGYDVGSASGGYHN